MVRNKKHMKKIILLFSILFILVEGCDTLQNLAHSKINNTLDNIPKVKISKNNDVNKLLDKAVDKTGKIVNKQMQEIIRKAKKQIVESYSVTDFQYAISYGDNSALYENKENYKNLSSFTYYLLDTDAPPIVQARNYNTAGELLFATGHYESAEKSLLAAYKIYTKQNILNSTEAILTISNLGLLYQTIGKYGLAETFTKKALNARGKNNDDTTGYAASLNNLGVLYKIEGKYTESENYLNKSAAFLKKTVGVNNIQYAIVLNNLSMTYQIVNKLKKAEKTLETALAIAKVYSKKESPTYSRLKINLALLYQSQGKYKESESIYKEVIKQRGQRLGKKHPDYATLLRAMASLYMKMGKYSEVEPLLSQAQKIYSDKFGTQNPIYAKTIYEEAVYYQAIGKFSQAKNLLTQALYIQQKTLAKHHPDIANTLEHIAINYWAENNPQEALSFYQKSLNEYIFQINTYFEAMSEGEKTKFWNEIQTKFILFYNFAAQYYSEIPQLASILYNYHIQTKALLLNSSRKVKERILKSNNTELIAKYNKWQDLKNYTAKLFALSNEELAERKINLDSIIELTENLERELTAASNDFKIASDKKKISSLDIKKKLDNNDVAVEIIRTNKYKNYKKTDSVFYIALILTKDKKNAEMVVMNNGNLMESDYIDQYHKAIMNGKNMGKFYSYFWEKINNKIPSYINNVFLSIDGIYNEININTILLPDNKYIIDKFHVYNLTNTKDVLTLKNNLKTHINLEGKTAVLVGFPDYLLNLPKDIGIIPPLPGTKQEVDNIQKLLLSKHWKIKMLMGKNANETNIKKVDNPFVLHIATHGYFLEKNNEEAENARSFGIEPARAIENPLLRSGLLFAGADKTVLELNDKDNTSIDDGILNAYEASVLNLDKTQLVVLSACQTGLGDIKTGEGVYGLQRSFQIAGAKTIITSLWKVSDKGTRDLMSNFYKNWLHSGDEFDAFRKAQLYIKKKYKYPYYWGAFELVGK